MIEILNPSIITEDDVVGQYHAFGPSAPSCGNTCDYTCTGEANSDSRPSGCSVCSTTCMGDCSGSCIGGCGDANCQGQCTLSCQSSCSQSCEFSCHGECTNGCSEECTTSCDQSCINACSGSCQGCTGCSGSCTEACVNGCKYSCLNVATTSGTHTLLPSWPTGTLSTEIQQAYYDAVKKQESDRTSDEQDLVDLINNTLAKWLIGGNVNLGSVQAYYDALAKPEDERTDEEKALIAEMEADIDPDRLIDMLNTIKVYLDEIVKYDHKRISELDEAVVIHDNDQFVAQIKTNDGQTIDIGEVDIEQLNLVVSDFDNKTVRITGASLAEFIKKNYKNYWVWTPYILDNAAIAWRFNASFEGNPPEPVNLAELITGGDIGVPDVINHKNGLMPWEMYGKLNGKTFVEFESLTGKHDDGSAATGVPLIRLKANFNDNNDSTHVFNESLLGDLDARYALNGTFIDITELENYYTKTESDDKYATQLSLTAYTTTADLQANYYSKDEINGDPLDKNSGFATNQALNDVAGRVRTHTDQIGSLNNSLNNNYYTQTQSNDRYVSKVNAHNDIDPRVYDATTPANNKNGLMTPADVNNISTALTSSSDAVNRVNTLSGQIDTINTALNNKIDRTAYAATNYSTGATTPGTVTLPVSSNIKVSANGVIDTKDSKVPNLIRNSTFIDGFTTDWITSISDVSQIDTTQSSLTEDYSLNAYIARLTLIADGTIAQQFFCDSNEGFTVGILIKRGDADKVIDVKIDNAEYQSHTISAVTTAGVDEYYVAKFYFNANDSEYFDYHELYIHNHDTSNAVSFEFTNIMVQQGRKYTGWMPNEHDSHSSGSVKIISYDNSITFKDLLERYASDVYDLDGVTLLHRAGDIIDPSSSIIIHKNKQYLFFHITAQNQIDGTIRSDTIPLRIDLYSGACDISGNATTAGTLRDVNDPSITLTIPVSQMNSFFNGASTAFIRYLDEFDSEDTDVPVAQRQWPKYLAEFRRVVSSTYEVNLGNFPLVGMFDPANRLKNGEIFNDYKNNSATGEYSHASGQNTKATADASTVIGKYNVADGTGVNDPKHLFIIGNGTADNDRSNIVEVTDDTLNVNGNITKNNNPIPEFVELTQAQYNALVTPDPDITYLITDYDASGGGSGGGGGEPFERTLLYDSGSYSSFAPYQQDVSLLDNLSNYDFIGVLITSVGDVSANPRIMQNWFIDTNIALNEPKMSYCMYKERALHVVFTETTFNIAFKSAVSESTSYYPEICKIYGYKMGSGGGGGTPTGLGDLAYKDSASGTAVTNVEYDENTHRIIITLGTVTVS